jgi:hypothetical protein
MPFRGLSKSVDDARKRTFGGDGLIEDKPSSWIERGCGLSPDMECSWTLHVHACQFMDVARLAERTFITSSRATLPGRSRDESGCYWATARRLPKRCRETSGRCPGIWAAIAPDTARTAFCNYRDAAGKLRG